MEEENFQEGPQDNKKFVFTILGAAVLIVLALGAFFFLRDYLRVAEDPFVDVRGEIYVTLAPVLGGRGTSNQADAEMYTLNLQSNQLTEIIPNDDSLKITSAPSPDGDKVAYMASPYDPESPYFYPASELSQLYVYDRIIGEQRQITDQETIGKRQPKWSPDGTKIAYYASEVETFKNLPFPPPPDEWAVYVTDLQGATEFIDNGIQPFWSPDGRYLLYVRNDGLHLYDTEDKQQRRVYGFGVEPLTAFMKFDLSDDGTMFARSYPKDNSITLHEITSWNPFSIQTVDVIQIEGWAATYWPVFSPDNRYLIFQWVDSNPETGAFFDFQLRVYDIETQQEKTLVSLESYRFDAAFVDEWVY